MQAEVSPLGDTIVAPATGPAAAAIAIVRLSGPDAHRIVRALTPAARPRRERRLSRAAVHDAAGRLLDDAMVVEMAAPRSYTGEDMAELHLHGAPAVVEAVLAGCVGHGARLAAPGEFTQRALLLGRIDLLQAEAVADLVAAESPAAATAAAAALRGGPSRRAAGWLRRLEGVLAAWQARADFPDEPDAAADAGVAAAEAATLAAVADEIAAFGAGATAAAPRRPVVALAGPPNAGKSTLLNAWAGEERALVDALAGTTRDAVEIALCDAGQHWSAVDTAGHRPDARGLEARGIASGRRRAADAALVLWLHPADRPWQPPPSLGPAPLAVVGSKRDVLAGDPAALEQACAAAGLPFAGWVAAAHQQGTVALRQWALASLRARLDAAGAGLRRRQHAALDAAAAALRRVRAGLAAGEPADLLAPMLREGAAALAGLLGRDVDAAVLGRLFADFCIGK